MRLGEITAAPRPAAAFKITRALLWSLALIAWLGVGWLHGPGVGISTGGGVIIIDGARPRVITEGGLFFYIPLLEGVTRVETEARRLSVDLSARLADATPARLEGVALRYHPEPAQVTAFLQLGETPQDRDAVVEAFAHEALAEALSALEPQALAEGLKPAVAAAERHANARLAPYGVTLEILEARAPRTPLDGLLEQARAQRRQLEALEAQRRSYEEEAHRAVEAVAREAGVAYAHAAAEADRRRREAAAAEAASSASVEHAAQAREAAALDELDAAQTRAAAARAAAPVRAEALRLRVEAAAEGGAALVDWAIIQRLLAPAAPEVEE